MNSGAVTYSLKSLLVRQSLTARNAFATAARAWHWFWFEPADPLLLGLIRVFTGWMLFYNLAVWTVDLEAFFTSSGLQPLDAVTRLYSGQWVFSFWLWIGDQWLWPVHIACLVVATMFCAGLASRLTSVLAFLITISYSQRVPVANFGLDQILGMLCLYLAAGPSGAALSLDALIRKWRQQRRGIAMSAVPAKFRTARMSMRLIQLHLCAIYFWAGMGKLKGPSWWTGEAMWRVVANAEYQTMDLTWLAWVPWVPYLVAHLTIIWEVFFVALVWVRPLRPLMLAAGVAMHIGIGAFLGMWTFGLIMTFAYLSFCDPDRARTKANRLISRISDRPESLADKADTKNCPESSVHFADDHEHTESDTGSDLSSDSGAEISCSERREPSEAMLSTSVLVLAERSADRSAMRRYLSSHGFRVRAVGDLSLALQQVATRRPDMVLTIGSGFDPQGLTDFCADIEDLGGIHILAVLRTGQQSLYKELVSRSAAHAIFHPASLREIRQAITAMLGSATPGSKPGADA